MISTLVAVLYRSGDVTGLRLEASSSFSVGVVPAMIAIIESQYVWHTFVSQLVSEMQRRTGTCTDAPHRGGYFGHLFISLIGCYVLSFAVIGSPRGKERAFA